ncbi:hypothetical protein F2P81_016691 [Scophthalmus maximus]|uniref:Uncharacterized protein n=1 Tax=Scophthalmus maximus TaxID=52904 RepID=A0A6A4SAB3_SCOMX|nr:hypothetical protein F2P81_016691 [Scophthalmus maximus]
MAAAAVRLFCRRSLTPTGSHAAANRSASWARNGLRSSDVGGHALRRRVHRSRSCRRKHQTPHKRRQRDAASEIRTLHNAVVPQETLTSPMLQDVIETHCKCSAEVTNTNAAPKDKTFSRRRPRLFFRRSGLRQDKGRLLAQPTTAHLEVERTTRHKEPPCRKWRIRPGRMMIIIFRKQLVMMDYAHCGWL